MVAEPADPVEELPLPVVDVAEEAAALDAAPEWELDAPAAVPADCELASPSRPSDPAGIDTAAANPTAGTRRGIRRMSPL